MHSDMAIAMVAQLLWTGLVICLPVLGAVMVVGLAVSLLQVVTQVQEMTLTFVPKLLTAGVALVISGPWMLRKLTQFTESLWLSIPSML
jgi:flagellar biosynthetic protein FliQ